ncbi:EamA-like transporter family protein [Pseudovibrio axinellae]|uniref:EamA-like transporter family protein n=1 Tax=Pseudovibrio axinellae TaxID=989403 RepID=A0A165ZPX6_9HYPH|nr:EamA-like transporter family protein [Pseudovibrio axinellae]SEQ23978.1 Permease of the drug/metabolite transporter (DMT) superfamily [Pseudovibrio axinellae]
MTTHHNNYIQGTFWALTAVLIWAGSLVLMRLGVTTSLNAYDLTALRFGTAAMLLIPVILKHGFAYDRLKLRGIVLIVTCFGAPYILLISFALTTASATAGGAINPGFMAVITVFLAPQAFKTRIGRAQLLGIGLILMGVLFTIRHEESGLPIGPALFVLTGSLWALYGLTVRKAKILALHATAIVAVGSALFYLPLYIIALPKQISTASARDILLQLGFQGVLVSVVAVYSFNRSAELLGPVMGATLPALIPIATLGIGAVVLHEPAGTGEITVATTIGLGVALILIGRKPKFKEKAILQEAQPPLKASSPKRSQLNSASSAALNIPAPAVAARDQKGGGGVLQGCAAPAEPLSRREPSPDCQTQAPQHGASDPAGLH